MTMRVAASAGGQAKFVIFSDASGAPGSLLASSAAFSTTTTGNKTAAISLPVTSGTKYWLGSVGNGSFFADMGGSSGIAASFVLARKESYTFATPPSSFGTADETDTGQAQQIWATIN
jgi:hypothetical protein